VSLPFDFHQASLYQNSHVMRHGRLRKLHPFFDVAGAQACVFSQRVSAFFFERLQDAAAGRVGDGVEKGTEVGGSGRHERKISRLLITFPHHGWPGAYNPAS